MSDLYKIAERVRELMDKGSSREEATKIAMAFMADGKADPGLVDTTAIWERGSTDDRLHLPVIMGASSKGRKPWWEVVPQEVVDAQFAKNKERIEAAEKRAKDPDRPLHFTYITTSGRNNKLSCAHEDSRSMSALKFARMLAENGDVAEHKWFDLWDMNIEHCNGCYGTEDYWCHWPCTCWPFDDMMDLYEEFVLSDAILFASPVNEGNAASRFYQMWHRLLCMDGGLDFQPPAGWKKGQEQLDAMREEMGEHKGITLIQRLLGKPFGILVLGHEVGAETAALSMMSGIGYRGGYVPIHAKVAKIYAGSGPNARDKEIMGSKNTFTEELTNDIVAMVDSLVVEAKTNRTKPRVVWRQERA